MIEGKFEDFTELDNDQITIWSKFVNGENFDTCFKYMEALAEMGNVNAICAYYVMKPHNHVNDIIIHQRKEQLSSHMLKEDLLDFYWNFTIANRCFADRDDFMAYNYQTEAIRIGQELLKNDPNNLLLKQKVYDVICNNYCMDKSYKVNWDELLQLHNDLSLAVCENKDDPRYLYYYARCVNVFLACEKMELLPDANTNIESKDNIFQTLAARPLSQTLQNYMKNKEIENNKDKRTK